MLERSDVTPDILRDPEKAVSVWSQLEEVRGGKPSVYALLREIGEMLTMPKVVNGLESRLHQHVRRDFRAIKKVWDEVRDTMCGNMEQYQCFMIGRFAYATVIQQREPLQVFMLLLKDVKRDHPDFTNLQALEFMPHWISVQAIVTS